jgi:GNAT superfamily N-acetyltransferase
MAEAVPVTLRHATPADRDALERLVAALQDDGRRYDPALATGERVTAMGSLDAMMAYAAQDQGLCLVAECAGEVVGYAGCCLVVDEDMWTDPDWSRSVHLQEMFVDPAFRRRGIGRRLIAEVEAHARRLGVPRVLVTANASNPESCGAYRASGFTDHKILFEKKL